jgi:hypothetical protein
MQLLGLELLRPASERLQANTDIADEPVALHDAISHGSATVASARPLLFRDGIAQPIDRLHSWIEFFEFSAQEFVNPRVAEVVLLGEFLLRESASREHLATIGPDLLDDAL